MRGDETKFSERIAFKCPPGFRETLDRASTRRMTSPSEYVRQATLERFRADGIDPTSTEAA